MDKIDSTVVSTLIRERDRLTKKAKRQSEQAQATLDQANKLSTTIAELKQLEKSSS